MTSLSNRVLAVGFDREDAVEEQVIWTEENHDDFSRLAGRTRSAAQAA